MLAGQTTLHQGGVVAVQGREIIMATQYYPDKESDGLSYP